MLSRPPSLDEYICMNIYMNIFFTVLSLPSKYVLYLFLSRFGELLLSTIKSIPRQNFESARILSTRSTNDIKQKVPRKITTKESSSNWRQTLSTTTSTVTQSLRVTRSSAPTKTTEKTKLFFVLIYCVCVSVSRVYVCLCVLCFYFPEFRCLHRR